jgi:hypothetical protein
MEWTQESVIEFIEHYKRKEVIWDPKHPKHFNPSNAELNPICHLLALLGAHSILHVSGIRVNKTKARKSSGTVKDEYF